MVIVAVVLAACRQGPPSVPFIPAFWLTPPASLSRCPLFSFLR